VKKIEALIKTSRLDEVVNRLRLIGTNGMTVTEAYGMSPSTVTSSVFQGQRLQKIIAPRYQVMVVVHDDDAAHVVNAVRLTARTETPGDGIITVTDVLGVMRIRTGEVDADAI
jgi:nitrogen regulatory protein PII